MVTWPNKRMRRQSELSKRRLQDGWGRARQLLGGTVIPPVDPEPTLFRFTDDFSGGANNADLSLREGWAREGGGRYAQTTGTNSVKHVAGSSPDTGYSVDTGSPDHAVQCEWMSLVNSTTFGVAGRMIDGSNYVAIRRNANQWQLFKTVNGGFTQLGSSPKPVEVGDVIRMEFVGDAVSCFRNGEPFIGTGPTILNAPELAGATKVGTVVRTAVTPIITNFDTEEIA